MKNLLIIGTGGHARPIIATAKMKSKFNICGLIDIDFNGKNESILDIPVLGGAEVISDYEPSSTAVIIAIGDNKTRKKKYLEVLRKGYELPNLIHPAAYVSESVNLGKANYIGPLSHLGPNVIIGNANIVNSYANIEHEVTMGNFSQVAPNSVVCGRCIIGNNVFIGANSTVIEQLTISNGTYIGAGSVIVSSINQPNKKFIGVPGRMV
jgi:sugar O-acyltransferase (sialic acid O-acetyltransferase NeuD family)